MGSEIPERIWVWNDARGFGRDWMRSQTDASDIEYVRSDKVAEAIAKERPQWQPMDAVPRDGTCILLAFPDGHVQSYVMKPEETRSVWIKQAPTHWMPLPDPPE